jgi:hypothetical protein
MTEPRNLTAGTVAGLGDAHLQRWAGPDAARWIFLGIATAFVLAVGGEGRPAMVGLATGGALAALAIGTGAVATDGALLSVPSLVS